MKENIIKFFEEVKDQGLLGFGFFFDVSGAPLLEDKQVQIKLAKLDTLDEKTNYFTNTTAFKNGATEIELPPYLLFNLDIYFGEKEQDFCVDKDDLSITVYIFDYGLHPKPKDEPALYYWVRYDGEKRWISHKDFVALQKKDEENLDMKITKLEPHGKSGVYSFQILKWPLNDRIIGVDG